MLIIVSKLSLLRRRWLTANWTLLPGLHLFAGELREVAALCAPQARLLLSARSSGTRRKRSRHSSWPSAPRPSRRADGRERKHPVSRLQQRLAHLEQSLHPEGRLCAIVDDGSEDIEVRIARCGAETGLSRPHRDRQALQRIARRMARSSPVPEPAFRDRTSVQSLRSIIYDGCVSLQSNWNASSGKNASGTKRRGRTSAVPVAGRPSSREQRPPRDCRSCRSRGQPDRPAIA
jgi:hypothetical protein